MTSPYAITSRVSIITVLLMVITWSSRVSFVIQLTFTLLRSYKYKFSHVF